MERDPRAVVRPVSKGRFRTLLSVRSNFATLNLCAAVMQQKASTWVDFISPYGQHSLYIYNKVYPVSRCTLFAYIEWLSLAYSLSLRLALSLLFPWESCAVVYRYIITGVGRLDVAYPHIGAMRRPDLRDKRERDILPRLFCFHN